MMFLEVIDVQLFGALNMVIEGYLYQEKCSLYELLEQHLSDMPGSSAPAFCHCAVLSHGLAPQLSQHNTPCLWS